MGAGHLKTLTSTRLYLFKRPVVDGAVLQSPVLVITLTHGCLKVDGGVEWFYA